MAAMVWMACQDRECPIKLLCRYHRGQLMRQRNPAESNGFGGSRQSHRAPSVRRSNRKQELLYSVVPEGAERIRYLIGRELLTPAIRE